jgi:hypothetical protein
MNKYSMTFVALAAAGLCTAARAGLFSDKFEMLVAADRTGDAPAQSAPLTCALVDGGYIEAGDPIAGETPPSPASVRQELQDALGQQGFTVGAPSPALLVTYHWGILRVDHREINVPFRINSNTDARIKLVSTEHDGAEVENHILGHKMGGGQTPDVSSPVILVGPLETVAENARKPRFFIIVSAYDYRGVADHQQPKLLWRTKLSAQESSGEMAEVIPSLIASGAPFLGKSLTDTKIVETTTMKSVADPAHDGPSTQMALASGSAGAQSITSLVRQEHEEFSGMPDGSS